MRPHELHDGAAVFPIFGAIVPLVVLVAAAAAYYVWRQGKLVLPAFGTRPVEDDAKRILAERFARGDIDIDEFMERASILNWTPGLRGASRRTASAPLPALTGAGSAFGCRGASNAWARPSTAPGTTR